MWRCIGPTIRRPPRHLGAGLLVRGGYPQWLRQWCQLQLAERRLAHIHGSQHQQFCGDVQDSAVPGVQLDHPTAAWTTRAPCLWGTSATTAYTFRSLTSRTPLPVAWVVFRSLLTAGISPTSPRYTPAQSPTSTGRSSDYQRRMTYGFTVQASYTWSHSMDEISNDGAPGTPYNGLTSISYQLNPLCLKCNNYGNADYDIRNSFNASYVWQTPWKFGNKFANGAFGGWTISQNFFARSGLPLTVLDSTPGASIANYSINNNTPLFPGGNRRQRTGKLQPVRYELSERWGLCYRGRSDELPQPDPQSVPRTRLLRLRSLGEQELQAHGETGVRFGRQPVQRFQSPELRVAGSYFRHGNFSPSCRPRLRQPVRTDRSLPAYLRDASSSSKGNWCSSPV